MEIEESRKRLEASCESEKSNLNKSLSSANKDNVALQAKIDDMSAKASLKDTQMGHGTNTLVLVSFILMMVGLLCGLCVMWWMKRKSKDKTSDGEEDDDIESS